MSFGPIILLSLVVIIIIIPCAISLTHVYTTMNSIMVIHNVNEGAGKDDATVLSLLLFLSTMSPSLFMPLFQILNFWWWFRQQRWCWLAVLYLYGLLLDALTKKALRMLKQLNLKLKDEKWQISTKLIMFLAWKLRKICMNFLKG